MIYREPIWTKRQLAILKENYELGVPLETIARPLERTPSAIRTRAQIMRLRRPGRTNKIEIAALMERAESVGLAAKLLPTNPSALRLMIYLSEHPVASKSELEEGCGLANSSRNKAIRLLRSTGLLFVDDFVSPAEIVLTQRAFENRVDLELDSLETGRSGLPSATDFASSLEYWLPKVCSSEAPAAQYRSFLLRQLENAQSEDITVPDFYSLFSSHSRE